MSAALLALVVLLVTVACGPAATASGEGVRSSAPAVVETSAHATLTANRGSEDGPRNLDEDERRGGHTLARHIGRSDDELRERLREERVSAASTWPDRETAERVIGAALEGNRSRIESWAGRGASRPNLAFEYHDLNGQAIGRSLKRGRKRTELCYDAVIVLKATHGRDWYVLTAYPEATR